MINIFIIVFIIKVIQLKLLIIQIIFKLNILLVQEQGI